MFEVDRGHGMGWLMGEESEEKIQLHIIQLQNIIATFIIIVSVPR